MAKYPLYPPLPGDSHEPFHNSLDQAPVGYPYPPSYLPLPGPLPDRRRSSSPSVLTPSPGASDGLSPSLSSVNTGSSQSSQAPAGMHYSYGGHVHGGWPTPGNSSYTVSSAAPPQPALSNQHFGGRPSIYSQPPTMQFNHPRTTHSPSGGEGLPPPPYGDVQHPFQTSLSSGGPGGHQSSSHHQSPQSAILSSQNPVSSQPPTPSTASTHVDSYTHTRPPPGTQTYYPASSTPQQSSFPSYAPQPSPNQHSPTTGGPISRGLGSISGPSQGPGMAPPAPYRSYPPYQSLPTMSGPVMSNIHQPGAQMSMMPAMGVSQYGHPLMYGHGQPAPQSERPFKCDQCVQSFSRNHDLKRHKRIHLAVKPFPCNFCSKSFSRKDALKRHRLVKGCEGKPSEGPNGNEGNGADRSVDGDEAEAKKET
ncbi:hypothetical protein QQX98_003316 [Neonectria punicea]|uniref:C2H2-type domain-containing protein n=1 Tax=Neonectria punicea TaxID=979145 RepID=A0ABR1HEE3_9HYPO